MLKLSLKEELQALHLYIEGRLVHPWCEELSKLHEDIKNKLGKRELVLNLCGTTFVDQQGIHLLQEIVRANKTKIVANTPITRHFAMQAQL